MADRQDQPGTVQRSPQDGEIQPSHHTSGGIFEIHVSGHLTSEWADWLEGFEMCMLADGTMILVGPVVDQAALIGVINKLYRLNLTLLSIKPVNQKGQEIK